MLARLIPLALLVMASCVEHLDPLPDAGGQSCLFGEGSFFVVTGVADGTSILIRDDDPGHGTVETDGDLELAGSSAAADYVFMIRGVNEQTKPGTLPVARGEPGISLQLLIKRPNLGQTELNSFGGELTLERFSNDALAGSFKATFNSKTDELSGCFDVELER